MIRKTIIAVLTLGTITLGTAGVLAGSGCNHWEQELWHRGPWGVAGSSRTTLFWGTKRIALVDTIVFLDGSSHIPMRQVWTGPGWLYQRTVLQPDDADFFVQGSQLFVSYLYLIALSALFAVYPTIAVARGPLRR